MHRIYRIKTHRDRPLRRLMHRTTIHGSVVFQACRRLQQAPLRVKRRCGSVDPYRLPLDFYPELEAFLAYALPSSSVRIFISYAIGSCISSRMWPTRPMARAMTPMPRTIFQGNPSSLEMAPMAPVALHGSGLLYMRSASLAIACISLTYDPVKPFSSAMANSRGARGSTGL